MEQCARCGAQVSTDEQGTLVDNSGGDVCEDDLPHTLGLVYEVRLVNTFTARSPEDAVSQMVTWVLDNGGQAGYRVTWQEDDRPIHKAAPGTSEHLWDFTRKTVCVSCNGEIKMVPGGQGTTYVHADGHVVGSGPETKTVFIDAERLGGRD